MGDVVDIGCVTTLDLSAERVLAAANEVGLVGVVIAGYRPDGSEYFASSYAGGADALWLLARMSRRLVAMGDAD